MTVPASLVDCGAGVRLERGVRCQMSDGVDLVSDHYYPPQSGAHPTLLMRQPYGRDIASTVVYAHPVWFARHGYNVVIQDVRGRGDSGGEFYPFRNEGRDGAETIAWARARAESNGSVGMYGFSYQGLTQLLAAAEQPEGLLCIAPGMTVHDLYHGWFYQGGALRLATSLGWGLQLLKEDAKRLKLREASERLEKAWSDLAAQTTVLPFRAHPAVCGQGLPSYVLDWFEHDLPGEFWSSLDISRSVDKIDVPALHVSGWYDMFLRGSVDGFVALSEGAGGDHARHNQYLIAGPWIHIPWGDRIGAADFGAEALLDIDEILLRWFNHWLRDSGEFSDEPKIRHFVLGENRWRTADHWPDGGSREGQHEAKHVLYLRSGGKANSRKGDGALSGTVAGLDEPPDVFVYDPAVPVPAPGGLTAAAGCFDQAALEMGNNMLVYTSEVLAESVRIFGTPRVVLFCSTSGGHTDFTAKIVRVTPKGTSEFVCIGVARSKWLFAESGYSVDTILRWEFELEPTSCLFSAGERIRLEIASSAFPLYDRNPGTAVASCCATSWDWARSTQIVYHDRDRPSGLHLPKCEGDE